MKRYGIAVLAVGLTLLVTELPQWAVKFEPIRSVIFTLFFFTVAMVAWRMGPGPGLLAAVLAASAISFFFLPPIYHLTIAAPKDQWRLAAFLLAAFLVNAVAMKDALFVDHQALRTALVNI